MVALTPRFHERPGRVQGGRGLAVCLPLAVRSPASRGPSLPIPSASPRCTGPGASLVAHLATSMALVRPNLGEDGSPVNHLTAAGVGVLTLHHLPPRVVPPGSTWERATTCRTGSRTVLLPVRWDPSVGPPAPSFSRRNRETSPRERPFHGQPTSSSPGIPSCLQGDGAWSGPPRRASLPRASPRPRRAPPRLSLSSARARRFGELPPDKSLVPGETHLYMASQRIGWSRPFRPHRTPAPPGPETPPVF